jgi:hypothetical protein
MLLMSPPRLTMTRGADPGFNLSSANDSIQTRPHDTNNRYYSIYASSLEDTMAYDNQILRSSTTQHANVPPPSLNLTGYYRQ